jgi:hypothetical protein
MNMLVMALLIKVLSSALLISRLMSVFALRGMDAPARREKID